MACPAFTTGSNFLSGVLEHIDCQASTLGMAGFSALSSPSSSTIVALTYLLTLFIAIFGIRLMLGYELEGRSLVGDIVRIGMVLTLASSWPAWRIVGYDLVMKGPQEIAGSLGNVSGLASGRADFTARLQRLDDGMVVMTMAGSGRLTGGVAAGPDLGDSPRGIAVSDQLALGLGRVTYLVATIGPLGLTRLAAGLLIAIAPLMAGLLLFGGTQSLFFGWLRALAAVALGNLALLITYGVEMAAVEPWLADVVNRRSSEILTPSAPGELLVLSLVFAVIAFGMLSLTARYAFYGVAGVPLLRGYIGKQQKAEALAANISALREAPRDEVSRADQLSTSVTRILQREAALGETGIGGPRGKDNRTAITLTTANRIEDPPLGSSWRRTARRISAAGQMRDARK